MTLGLVLILLLLPRETLVSVWNSLHVHLAQKTPGVTSSSCGGHYSGLVDDLSSTFPFPLPSTSACILESYQWSSQKSSSSLDRQARDCRVPGAGIHRGGEMVSFLVLPQLERGTFFCMVARKHCSCDLPTGSTYLTCSLDFTSFHLDIL